MTLDLWKAEFWGREGGGVVMEEGREPEIDRSVSRS